MPFTLWVFSVLLLYYQQSGSIVCYKCIPRLTFAIQNGCYSIAILMTVATTKNTAKHILTRRKNLKKKTKELKISFLWVKISYHYSYFFLHHNVFAFCVFNFSSFSSLFFDFFLVFRFCVHSINWCDSYKLYWHWLVFYFYFLRWIMQNGICSNKMLYSIDSIIQLV